MMLIYDTHEEDDFIISHSALRARPAASKFELQSLEGWLEDYNEAICPEEAEMFKQTADLIPIVTKEKPLLRYWVERCGKLVTSFPFKQELQSQFLDEKDPTTRYFNDRSVDRSVYIVMVVVGLGMLIRPLWWLYKAPSSTYRLGIITGFIVLFSTLLGATQAKPHEALAAIAA